MHSDCHRGLAQKAPCCCCCPYIAITPCCCYTNITSCQHPATSRPSNITACCHGHDEPIPGDHHAGVGLLAGTMDGVSTWPHQQHQMYWSHGLLPQCQLMAAPLSCTKHLQGVRTQTELMSDDVHQIRTSTITNLAVVSQQQRHAGCRHGHL
jgi:hypothetical protein